MNKLEKRWAKTSKGYKMFLYAWGEPQGPYINQDAKFLHVSLFFCVDKGN